MTSRIVLITGASRGIGGATGLAHEYLAYAASKTAVDTLTRAGSRRSGHSG